MAKPGAKGLRRIVNATFYSMKGIKAGLINEAAFRQEAFLSVCMIIAAVFIAKDVVQFILLLLGPFLVMTVEILNSAIESVVDRIGNEYHELSGRAKDMGSAAVFFMLIFTLISWLAIIDLNYLNWVFTK
ncbi:MAG: diacylglycerol kinase [Succinivibrionaceae bacterium]|nr:diacylglycerol kinase [Succinivibrionaceae bacterium]MEE1340165.1 diacylglycerol kinase [Succinivibrionaceae bacterium]